MTDMLARELPRLIAPDVLWTGGCVELRLRGELVHTHFSNFVVKGSEKVLLFDTGHPDFAARIEHDLLEFLDGRAADYILVSHCEFPHFGLAPKWLEMFPGCKLLGDVRDHHLYYPEYAHRMERVHPGDRIDLGDRDVVVLPSIWADLPETLWGFETRNRILFCSDGFSSTHIHTPGHCGLTSSEQTLPSQKMMRMSNEIILQWTKYLSVENTFAPIDRLIEMLQPRTIAPAHGPVIDNPEIVVPIIKAGMREDPQIVTNG